MRNIFLFFVALFFHAQLGLAYANGVLNWFPGHAHSFLGVEKPLCHTTRSEEYLKTFHDYRQGTFNHRLSFSSKIGQVGHTFYPLKDTTPFVLDTSYHHKWKHATIWSACIPGAGQIYNEIGYRKIKNKKHRAWWKVPIIYGALGVTGYYFYDYLALARSQKTEWIYRGENPNLLLYPEFYDWSRQELIDGKALPKLDENGNQLYNSEGDPLFYTSPGFDLAAKRRDMLAFGFLAIWGLQTVEALVDGHFVHFDVSEDLSFSWSPTMITRETMGFSVRLQFN